MADRLNTPLADLIRGVLLAVGVALLSLITAVGVTAQEETTPPDWSDLLAEVEAHLEGLRSQIERAEASKDPIKRAERDALFEEFRFLESPMKTLQERKQEATTEELNRLEDAEGLLNRLEAVLQSSQSFEAPEEARDAPQIETMITNFAFYGSLRARAFFNSEEGTTLDDSTSRLGLRGQLRVTRRYKFFGRLEVGTNIVGDVTRFLVGGDPGTQEGSENVAIPLRLAFIGFEGFAGRPTFGKQWSVYYDVAVFTDQAPFFGGTASGTYAAGTDGGISGTGRANQALQYRFALEPFKIGIQTQLRNITDNNQPIADAWGISAIYHWKEGVTVGAAFNEVRDGVPDPQPEQSKEGDQAAILGVRWQDDKNYYALTYTDFRNHEKDDMNRFYSGYGVELYAHHEFTERFGIGGTWNHQKPDSQHPGEFEVDFLSLGASYHIPEHWRFYLIYKFDSSRNSAGDEIGHDTLGAAVFYNFSRGFSLF